MNELIFKLAEQAGFDVKRLLEPYPGGFPREDFLALESFAKLIVMECAAVQHKRFCEHGDVSWDILMEHFGFLE